MKKRKQNWIVGFQEFGLSPIALTEEQTQALREYPTTINGKYCCVCCDRVIHGGKEVDSIRVNWHYPHHSDGGVTIFFTESDFEKIINNKNH